MSDYRIDCITKPHHENTHEHITHVGGPDGSGRRWREPVETIIIYIERGVNRYFVDEGGVRVYVGVRKNAAGRKYLQTHADGVWKNNLLSLAECR
jgi:hypothetical protein